MRQPIRKGKLINKSKPKVKKRLRRPDGKLERVHPKFGTSKLEQDFAEQFLDTLGVDYIWQFEAKDIGRFFDFYLPGHNLILEIDGSYFHSDPRIVKEEDMSPMQKKNRRVDEYKNRWALEHGIPLMRIWEKDIRENPDKVMNELKKRLYIEETKQAIKKNKSKRHVNVIK